MAVSSRSWQVSQYSYCSNCKTQVDNQKAAIVRAVRYSGEAAGLGELKFCGWREGKPLGVGRLSFSLGSMCRVCL